MTQFFLHPSGGGGLLADRCLDRNDPARIKDDDFPAIIPRQANEGEITGVTVCPDMSQLVEFPGSRFIGRRLAPGHKTAGLLFEQIVGKPAFKAVHDLHHTAIAAAVDSALFRRVDDVPVQSAVLQRLATENIVLDIRPRGLAQRDPDDLVREIRRTQNLVAGAARDVVSQTH